MVIADCMCVFLRDTQEDWTAEVTRDIVPVVIKAHLEGELRKLKPYLGEAVYNKLAADIRTVSSDMRGLVVCMSGKRG